MDMDINSILKVLPHRYPLLLIDKVLSLEPGKNIVAIKNVSINESFFQGHFPNLPVMPGVLIIEALAQAAGILSFKTENHVADGNFMYYLVGIDNARFKKTVLPGDRLLLSVQITRFVQGVSKYTAQAKVDDILVAEADLMCAMRAINEKDTF